MALNKPTGDMLNAGSNSAAQDLGTAAAAGTSTSYSRADHVHKLPSAADVGAIATSQLGVVSGVATLDAGGKLTTAQIPALTTAQISQITPAGIGAVATGDVIAISKGGTGSTTASAARTALDITPANIGAMSTSERAGLATLTAGTLTTTQALALTGDVTSDAGNPATVVGKIQGKAISNATPTTGQTLVWDGAQWAPATSNNTGGGGGANGLTYFLNQATAADAPVTNIPGTPHQLGRSGEAGQTAVTSGTLAQNTWTLIAGFVSEAAPQDPATILIPAGLWDTNVWCFGDANVNAGTSIRAVAYIYSLAGGGTLTALGSPSSSQVINGTSAQYSLSVLVPQTAVLATDRIYIALEAYAIGNNHTVTAQFGDSTPSHVHTSLPLVGGTGLWKNVSGALQSPASLLFDADVDASAAIANSKIAGLAASATTDATNASNITSGTLRTDQLATISGLPTGAQGSATAIPSVTVDAKGRVTGLTTSALASYVLTSDLTTLATASKVPQLDAAGKLSTAQVPALTTAQISQITPVGIGAIATDQLSTLAKLSGSTLRTDQMAALTGDVTSAAGNPATTVEKLRGRTVATTAPTAGQVLTWNNGTSQWEPSLASAGTVTTSGTTLTGSLSKFSSETEITKAVAGTDYQAALTTAQPLALTRGGTGAASAQSAISNLGIGMRMVEAQTTANIVGTMNTGVSPNTFTVTATGVFTTDSYTPVLGDIIAFAVQTTTTQNGFWELTTLGTAGVSAVFTRPSWYTGVVKNAMYMTRFGSAQNGFVQTFVGPIGTGNTEITVGTTNITMIRVNLRASPASLGTNLFTGYQTFRANAATTNTAPFYFQTGAALMTAPQANAVEWFNDQMYLTTAAAVRKAVAFTDSSITGFTGTLAVTNGGTGQTAYTNGQLLIGNTTGSTLAKATLTQGSGIAITNGAGAITVSYAPTVSAVAPTSGDGANGDFWYQY